MAFSAIYFSVHAFQGIVGNGVIEEIHILHGNKTFLSVAFGTILSVFIFVRIFMALHTVVFLSCNFILKYLGWAACFGVAAKTINRFVLSL